MGGNNVMLKKENLSNLISDDLKSRNENWEVLDAYLKNPKFKEVKADEVWTTKSPGDEAIFSTPVYAKFSDGRKVVIYQSWDWYIYVRDVSTGELIWRDHFDDANYGRPQAEDVNGDGKIEIIGASHDGKIRCWNESGTVLWTQYNMYLKDDYVSGTATGGSDWSIIDTTKSWVKNSFIRPSKEGNLNGEQNAWVEIISGKGAGQKVNISSAEGNTLWTATALDPIPDATSVYKITPAYESDHYFQHAGQLNKEGNKWYLYVTGFDNMCRKLDATTGDIIWLFSALEHNEPFPLIVDIDGDGVLECLFGSVDENVYCLNAVNGELKWNATLPYNAGVDCFPQAYDMDGDGELEYVTNSRGGRTYYLNGKDGSVKYKSTDYTTWTTSEANSRPTVFNMPDGSPACVWGGLAGYVYCLDGEANTIWRKYLGPNMRGSTNIVDVDGDGQLEILVPDMMGTLTILDLDGKEIGQVNMKGGIEGTPLVGDLEGDGNIEVILNSLDGYTSCYRFRKTNE